VGTTASHRFDIEFYKKSTSPEKGRGYRPLGTTPDSLIRLHIPETYKASAEHPYIALSYGYGRALPLRTTNATLDEHCDGIPFDVFPRTLQDAIHVTKGLGLRYIWINALCIIQDDEKNWEEQAALMGEIYEGSTLKISATLCPSLDAGFLRRSGGKPSLCVKVGKYFHKDGQHHGGICVDLHEALGSSENAPIELNSTFLSSRG
jgi:hypothetical protein